MSSAATFIAAVQALNGPPGDAQRQADSWLSEFKYSADAWPTILQLLRQDIPHDVLFHITSIAVSKAKNDWRRLSPDERQQVTKVIRCATYLVFAREGMDSVLAMHLAVERPAAFCVEYCHAALNEVHEHSRCALQRSSQWLRGWRHTQVRTGPPVHG